MKVKINEIQNALNIVFENFKENKGEDFEIDLTEDFYYYIPKEQLYNIGVMPIEFTIGSLIDDSEIVKGINFGQNYPIPTDLLKLSTLLRYLGETLV